MNAVLAALEAEASQALRGSWAEIRVLVGEVFDHEASASVMGEYDSFDYDLVQIDGLLDATNSDYGADS